MGGVVVGDTLAIFRDGKSECVGWGGRAGVRVEHAREVGHVEAGEEVGGGKVGKG